MTSRFRRFEILIPLRFNDGKEIPTELVAETLLELEHEFGAVSSESQAIHGRWRHEGRSYHDELARIFVDAPDSPEVITFFQKYKDVLKTRFQQIEIWMTTYLIDVI